MDTCRHTFFISSSCTLLFRRKLIIVFLFRTITIAVQGTKCTDTYCMRHACIPSQHQHLYYTVKELVAVVSHRDVLEHLHLGKTSGTSTSTSTLYECVIQVPGTWYLHHYHILDRSLKYVIDVKKM